MNYQAWKVDFTNPTGTPLSWIVCISNYERNCEYFTGDTVERIKAAICEKHRWNFIMIKKIDHLDRAFILDFILDGKLKETNDK